MDKRTFLKNAGLLGLGSMIEPSGLSELFKSVSDIPPVKLAEDEKFWKEVRAGYRLNRLYKP